MRILTVWRIMGIITAPSSPTGLAGTAEGNRLLRRQSAFCRHVASAERRAAEIYGAKHGRFLCGGSSQGVKAAVMFSGGGIIADVNSHRSVFDGARLAGAKCRTVGEKGSVYPIAPRDIMNALDGASGEDIRAVVLTTPTYYGYCADVDGIAELCKKRGLLFICDGAHGAHFGFSDKLPKSVAPYCDICNLSAHKTLSALTQSAMLFDNLDGEKSGALNDVVDIMGTTSPSYLLYASIDYAVRRAASEETAAAYAALYDATEDIKREFPFLRNDDFSRLVLDCAALGVSPRELNDRLCRLRVVPPTPEGAGARGEGAPFCLEGRCPYGENRESRDHSYSR